MLDDPTQIYWRHTLTGLVIEILNGFDTHPPQQWSTLPAVLELADPLRVVAPQLADNLRDALNAADHDGADVTVPKIGAVLSQVRLLCEQANGGVNLALLPEAADLPKPSVAHLVHFIPALTSDSPSSAVYVAARDGRGRIGLVLQYSVGRRSWELRLPGGPIDEPDNATHWARGFLTRDLDVTGDLVLLARVHEVGFVANHRVSVFLAPAVTSMITSSGASDEFAATAAMSPELSSTLSIRRVWVSQHDLEDLVAKGQITHGPTVVATYRVGCRDRHTAPAPTSDQPPDADSPP